MEAPLDLVRRGRSYQKMVMDAGGPLPRDRKRFAEAVKKFDEAEMALQLSGGLGFLFLPLLFELAAAVALIYGIVVGKSVMDTAANEATSTTQAGGDAARKTLGLTPWLVGGAGLIWLNNLYKKGQRRKGRAA